MCVCVCTAELVTKLYESAVKKVPSSEEYHSHLFMAYARVGEYKKMQQVSVSLSLSCTHTRTHTPSKVTYTQTHWFLRV